MQKPGRSTPRDPRLKKKRDAARQRKIAANSSDKAARRNAPKIKALDKRRLRRRDKERVQKQADGLSEGADAARAKEKTRRNHWGSDNAAERRAKRDKERAWLQATAGQREPGRGGWMHDERAAFQAGDMAKLRHLLRSRSSEDG